MRRCGGERRGGATDFTFHTLLRPRAQCSEGGAAKEQEAQESI
jgi:hypothetical protein